ncbi:MAG: hypothetical protein CVT80_06110, partial [Alphaproteobacteria bacterium HGW-Alphaproteobacteria-2]
MRCARAPPPRSRPTRSRRPGCARSGKALTPPRPDQSHGARRDDHPPAPRHRRAWHRRRRARGHRAEERR